MTSTTSTPRTAGGTAAGCGCPDFGTSGLSRRRLLQGAAAAGLGLAAVSVFGDSFRQVAYGAEPGGNVVVVLSLRGGVDGLSLVVPRGADHDFLDNQWRPSTVVPEASLLGNDPRFGLHPAFAPLMPMWNAGSFGAVHATGLPVPNHSHFESMETVEEANPGSTARIGWINRTVGLDSGDSPQSAVQLGTAMLPTSMVGPAQALGANSLTDLALPPLNNMSDAVRRDALDKAWAADTSLFGNTVRSAMATTATLDPLVLSASRPDGDVHATAYPDGPLKAVLSNTSALIRADLGTTMVTIDYGSWDMHAGMVNGDKDPSNGWMHDMVTHLATSLQAFFSDLGSSASRVTVVTLSEFGRRVQENGDRGVDHGYANAILMLGAGVKGGSVHGRWPGLAPQDLDDGDLALGQDYRSVLWEVISSRFPAYTGQRSTIFPGFTPERVGSMA